MERFVIMVICKNGNHRRQKRVIGIFVVSGYFFKVPDKKPEEEMTEDTVEDDYSSAKIRSNLRSLIDIENSVIEKTREKTGESSVLTHSLRAATEASIKKLQTRMSVWSFDFQLIEFSYVSFPFFSCIEVA